MIVGIIGHSGSGKDTMADYLVSNCNFTKIALADPLKRFCKEVFSFSDDQLWGPSEERNRPVGRLGTRPDGTFLTPREALQLLGTEWGRKCHPNTWVNLCVNTINCLECGWGYTQKSGVIRTTAFLDKVFRAKKLVRVVIPDVRFVNEVEVLRNEGAVIVKVSRLGKDGKVGIANHSSETELDSIPSNLIDLNLVIPEGIDNYFKIISSNYPVMEQISLRRNLEYSVASNK